VCATLQANLAAPIGDADESKLDTARIQEAIDKCTPGKAVEFKTDGSKSAFLSAPLQLRSGVTLLIDKGATLYGSRNPRDYDITPGRCGTVDKRGRGCKPLIGGDGVENAGVMGDGAIDGRGGAKLTGQKDSWWDLAQQAKVKKEAQNVPRVLVLTHAKNITLYRIALKNSPNFHVSFNGDGLTAWGVVIDAPKTSRNTDGIDPANSTNVTITHCFIHTGDDQVAIKSGGSQNGAAPSTHMTIAHNHFYTGHGMSIGSETDAGVSAIRVSDLTIDGADNGLRIKSNITRGGLVTDVEYDDVCIENTKNPIFMDSNYTASVGPTRDKPPTFTGIVLRNVRVLTPGKITLDGLDEHHVLGMLFDGVSIAAGSKTVEQQAHIEGRGNAKNSCAGRFEPMPKR
ncbi:MAG TPA: glycosyl hydrolase family 28 protein, partial [Bryobacteraceae bacterium]|nr:glycosyl hydrolase family 28 protein [Bryobacteraceae bacterium]